jgi:glycosyltransferase involved in cell wall biosynthesis
MKIGFDAKRAFHNSTGLGNYSRDLIRVLNKFESKNEYFLFNPKKAKKQSFSIPDRSTEVNPNKPIWKKLSSFWRQGPISKQVKELNIDVYHGLSGEIPKGLKDIKSTVTIHDLIFITQPQLYKYFDRIIHFKKHLYAANNANKIIAISEQTKKDIVKYLKVPENKIEVIYQGCHEVFKSNIENNFLKEVKNKYELPNEFILNVGTIEKRKNILSVIKAIKNIDTHLVVIGRKTDYFNEIKKYITENKLQNKVTFLHGVNIKELASIYKLATIFTYPSIYEGFGIPIIEALYSRTPVITNKFGVFPEAGGPSSIYVDVTNTKEITENIKRLLKYPEIRKDITDSGFKFAQKFNDKEIANQIMDVYNTILKNG